MTPRLVALDAVPPQPWKNGGGVTRELLASPAGGEWTLRISVAEIEADGPFSSFPGVSRWFVVLEGGGVALSVDGTERRCRVGDPPFAFAGASTVDCRLLGGPSRDLNLMLRGADGVMAPAVAGEAWSPRARRCGLYAGVAGRCLAGAASTDVPAATLAWFDVAPAELRFEPEAAPGAAAAGWWLAADLEDASG